MIILVHRSAAHPVERRIASALASLGRSTSTTTRSSRSIQTSTSNSSTAFQAALALTHCSSSFLRRLTTTAPHHDALGFRSLHGASAPRPTSSSPPPPLTAQISDQLSLPCFQVPSSSLRLLASPRHFYSTLLRLIDGAKDRIFLSSLYFGKGEEDLINHIRAALLRSPTLRVHLLADSLRSTREGPYNNDSSSHSGASLLASLARDFPDRVDVRLYRAPGLPTWLERLVGKRFVEGWGLQHMKVYGCDDQVIISGANLSTDYFTNRQDRYLVLSDRTVSDYLHSMLLLVSRFSYSLTSPAAPQKGNSSTTRQEASHAPYSLTWDGGSGLLLTETHDGTVEPADSPAGMQPPDFSSMESDWKTKAGEELRELTKRWREFAKSAREAGGTTRMKEGEVMANVVPLLQMGPLGITQETEAIPMLFEHLAALTRGDEGVRRPTSTTSSSSTASSIVDDSERTDFEDVIGPEASSTASVKPITDPSATLTPTSNSPSTPTPLIDLTSGYFSLIPSYKSLILHSPRLPVRIIAASPRANGFYGSKGVSRHLPAAYTWLERGFWEEGKKLGRIGGERGVELREWARQGWTYHAKGIWLRSSRSSAPHLTLIGSSNLGNRSAKLDLECTLLIDVPLNHATEGSDTTSTSTSTAQSQRNKERQKISLTSTDSDFEELDSPKVGPDGKLVAPVTEPEPFPEQLKLEVHALREHARQVVDASLFERQERKVGWGVRFATWVIAGML